MNYYIVTFFDSEPGIPYFIDGISITSSLPHATPFHSHLEAHQTMSCFCGVYGDYMVANEDELMIMSIISE